MNISAEDLQSLKSAKKSLEHPSLPARLASMAGAPLEKGLVLLPKQAQSLIHKTAEKSIHLSYQAANKTLNKKTHTKPDNFFHRALVVGSGAASGLFGPAALLAELPFSTSVIMRSIIDIAISEGEDPASLETQYACLEVFAFGGYSKSDDTAGSGYFMTRAALAKSLGDVAKNVGNRVLTKESAPMVTRWLSAIASRFQVVVGEKLAAQLVPVIGALGGATVNLVFMNHFQEMARGHFTVRRLERKYGYDLVRNHYNEM